MLVKVTGGMSLVDGGFCELCPAVCGKSPVRIIGGWSRVEMAVEKVLA